MNRGRVTIDAAAVERIVDRRGAVGAAAVASFLESEQKATVRSDRLRAAITSEYGRDIHGWYARAGMKPVAGTAAFFWYFHEYQTGRGAPGVPFIRPALENNTQTVARMFLRGGGL